MTGLVPDAVAALGLLLVVLSLRGIARARRSRPELVLGVLVLLLTGVAADTRLGIGTLPRIGVALAGVAVGSLGLLGATRRSEPLPAVRALGLLALLLATTGGFAVDAVLADVAGVAQVFGRLVPLVSWAFCALAVQSRLLDAEDVLLLVVAVFGLCGLGAVLFGDPWSGCTIFKCGPFGALLNGPFASENGFARLACLAALATLRQRDPWIRAVGGASVVLVLDASGSRTSQIALLAALAGWASWRFLPAGARRLSALCLPPAAVAAGGYLVSTAGPADFSNRGSIWMLGRQAVGGRWWLGRGLDNWSVHVLARNYMHSEVLLLVYSGGALLAGLYVVHVVAAGLASVGSSSGYAAGLMVLVCVAGLTEIVWNPLALDGSTVAIVMLLFAPDVGSRPVVRPVGRRRSAPAVRARAMSAGPA